MTALAHARMNTLNSATSVQPGDRPGTCTLSAD